MSSLLVKISILSISLLTVMASAAISPALAKIRQAFPGTDITLIKLVLTLPSLLIIPFSLLGGWLASRMQKKTILLVGLVIYFLGGVGGGFAKSITQLLVIRGIFGIGVGLIIPLSISLIADFYEKQERAKMMGLSGSVSHFGGVVFLLLSGWLACMSWRYAFGVYGLSALIMVTVFFWLPEPPVKQAAGSAKVALPWQIYWCAFIGSLMMVAFYAAPTNLAMFIENQQQMYTSTMPLFKDKAELEAHLQAGTLSESVRQSFGNNGITLSQKATFSVKEPGRSWVIRDRSRKFLVTKEADRLAIHSERIGRPGIAGFYLSTMTMVGVVSGVILAALLHIFGPYCTALGIASMALGYALLGRTYSLTGVLVSMLFIGFSSGILMPILLLRVARITPEQGRALSMAIVSCGIYLGQFLSPVALKAASMFPGADVFRSQFNFLAAGLLFATVWALVSAFQSARSGGFEQYRSVKVPGH